MIEYHKLSEYHKLIMKDEWIPKSEMVKNVHYLCKARNFRVGRWNGKSFTYESEQGNMIYEDTEMHWDDGPPFGTVKPFKQVK